MTQSTSSSLMSALNRGESILMDGALGTEIERRGAAVDQLGWSALAVKDNSDLIEAIHLDYIRAGARLHIVNSFCLSKHVLDSIELGDEFRKLNARSVELFNSSVRKSGVDRESLWVGGSLSTFAAFSDRTRLPPPAELAINTQMQAEALCHAGVDFFALEMLFDVETSIIMLEATQNFQLPVIMGFTCDYYSIAGERTVCCRQMSGKLLTFEETLKDFVPHTTENSTVLAIMHGDYDVSTEALDIARRYWAGPIAIYPNSGSFKDLKLQFDTVSSIEEFCEVSKTWLEREVQIIGGCCGIGPPHIQALRKHITKINQTT